MGSKEGSEPSPNPANTCTSCAVRWDAVNPNALICSNTDRMGTSDRHGYLNNRPYCNGKKE